MADEAENLSIVYSQQNGSNVERIYVMKCTIIQSRVNVETLASV